MLSPAEDALDMVDKGASGGPGLGLLAATARLVKRLSCPGLSEEHGTPSLTGLL